MGYAPTFFGVDGMDGILTARTSMPLWLKASTC